MNHQDIMNLSPHERFLLYLAAYNNCWLPSSLTETFRHTFRITLKEYDSALRRLINKRFLFAQRWTSNSYIVSGSDRVDILLCLFRHDNAVSEKIRLLRSPSNTHADLFDVLRYAVTGNDKPSVGVLPKSCVGCFAPHVYAPWFPVVAAYIADADYYSLIDNKLYASVMSGKAIDSDSLTALCSTDGRNPETASKLLDLRDYYNYIAFGTETPRDGRPASEWAFILFGIKAALLGQYSEAVKSFSLALKVLNKNMAVKNVFPDLIPQYCYVMSLVHLGTPDARKKLSVIIKKDSDFPSVLISKVIACAFLSESGTPEKNTVKSLWRNFTDPRDPLGGCSALVWLLDRYFNTGVCDKDISMPEFAFLRHELAAYLVLGDDESRCLRTVYGDTPLLSSIHKKEAWERAIDDILDSIAAQPTGTDGIVHTPDSGRIIYIEQSDGTFEPKYQTRLKSGRWSAPRNVAKKRFCDCEAEYMDSADRAVATQIKRSLSHSLSYNFEIEVRPECLFPNLVGSDRVFYTKRGVLCPITIEEGKPYVAVKKSATGYVVEAPLSLTALSYKNAKKFCQRIDKDKVIVFDISDAERVILSRLLAVGTFPKQAEPMLQKLLARIADVMEIRSPLLDSKSVTEVAGAALICLKVENVSSAPYPLSISVLPYAKGSVRCLPAEGKSVYYDTDDGTMVRVKRNFNAERINYRSVIDAIDSDESPVGEGDYNVSLSVEGLLDLIDFVKHNPDVAVMEWPEGKAVRLRQPLSQGVWNVGLKGGNGWFDLEGDVRIDNDTVLTMSRVLELVAASKDRFIRLGDNDFVEIDKKLRRQLERLEAMASRHRNHLQISQFGAAALDDSVLDGEIKIQFDDKLASLRKKILESDSLEPRAPRALHATLRPYQLEGFRWMMRLASWGAGACLADDMGLGKTVQTIAFLLAKSKEGPALITAPASVVPNWQSELARFAPTLGVTVLNKAESRQTAIGNAGPGDVVLCTYGLLNTGQEYLAARHWTTVCLDEAHTIKNRDTKMSQSAMNLQADYRIILTGTPIQNHLGELWNLFRFINPGLLGSYESFRNRFAVPIQEGDKDRQRALQRLLKPFMLRRTKEEVIDDLPDKTEIIMPVELSQEEMSMYEALRRKAVADLEKAEKLDVNTLSEITRLRRAACSISLVDDQWKGAEAKVQAFLDLTADFKGDGGNRMLVFSQFTSFLDIVRKALDAAGEKYLYLDGSTTMRQREKLIREFREGSCPLFLISLKAGGLGLNLPEANYVVHLDPWWNPAIEQQATDRAYRIGQKRNVTVYHLIAANTIEEKILRLHRTKRDLSDSLLSGADMAGKLTVADILELLAPQS